MELLKRGSAGPNVELVQLALNRAGANVALDGLFGPATESAVRAFQRAQGLVADGVVGEKTFSRLSAYIRGYIRHTIQRGDTFVGLARRYMTSVQAISTANPTVSPRFMRIGDVLIIPLGYAVVPTSIRYTSLLVSLVAEGLLARYPFLGRAVIGQSVLGSPLETLRLGQGKNAFYNASHHANEWITTPLLLKFFEEAAFAYAGETELYGRPAAELFSSVQLTIAPLVNPDGVDLVNGAFAPGSAPYRRAAALSANYPEIPFPSGWKANIEGTDLNLNYPAGWEQARRIKAEQGYTLPGPRDFVGTAPLSAPESRAMYEYTRALSPLLTISCHTQGEVIYWKFLDYDPPGALAIAQKMSAASGYAVETTPYASGFAGYKDWFIQDFNRPGYTVEFGRGVNPLPLSDFQRIYRAAGGILIEGLAALA